MLYRFYIYGLLCLPSFSHAILTNPPQNTSVTTTETIQYNTNVNAGSLNNLNINPSTTGQTFSVNVLNGGNMSNSTILRDIINITGPSTTVLVEVSNGGAITHNSNTKEILDDDGGNGGTVRLTVRSGGTTTGRYNGNLSRTISEIINEGIMHGDHNSLTSVTNSGTMDGGGISAVTQVTNTGVISGNIYLNTSGTITNSGTINSGTIFMSENCILNNNGSGTIGSTISGNINTELRIGPSSSNNFITSGNIYSVTNISLLNTSSLTVSSGTSISNFTAMSGARPVNINPGGEVQIDSANALAITGALTNSGTLRVNNIFNPTVAASFTTTNGIIEVNSSGAVTNNVSATGASIFRIGTNGAANFTTQGTIASFPIFIVDANSSNLNANHLISGVNTSFAVNPDCSATFTVAPTGTGSFTNSGTVTTNTTNAIRLTGVFSNTGTLHVNNAFTTINFVTPSNSGTININGSTFTTNASFTNNNIINTNNTTAAISGPLVGSLGSSLNIGPVTANTFVASNTINGVRNINVIQGSFSSGFAISNVDTSFNVSSGQSATFTSSLSGVGTVQNDGTFTLGAGSSLTNFASVTNNGTLLVTGLTANTTHITNNSIMTITSNLTNNGSITNAGTLTFGGNANNTNAVTNNAIFNVSGSSINSAILTNNSQMTVSNVLSGGGTILNNGGNLTYANGTNSNNAVTNNAVFNISGSSSNSAVLINNSHMTVSNVLSGSGSIINANNATLTLQTNANITNSITNNVSGTLNVLANVITSAITNNGAMTMSGNISMPGQILNCADANSTLTVNGQRTLTAASYNSNGIIYATITSEHVNDYLSIIGNSTLTNARINVSAPPMLNGSWTILSTTGTLEPPSISNISLPNSTSDNLFSGWAAAIIGNSIVIKSGGKPFVDFADGIINQEIAQTLDNMSNNITNSGQQILTDAFAASNNVEKFNNYLQQMRPNTNVSAPILLLYSKIFSEVEGRIANLNSGIPTNLRGFSSGDCNYNTALWASGFGGFSKQQPVGENFGYNAKSFGTILGIDTRIDKLGVFGLGLALSKTIVDEKINPNCTSSIIGYHFLTYGSNPFADSTFLEWLVTSALTATKGSRQINVNDVVMSTTAQYHGAQASIMMNYGINFELEEIAKLSPLLNLQYSALYQPNYYENYSPAALHIAPTNFQDILTVGAGARLSLPYDDWWMNGVHVLRVSGSYDIITSKNNIVSNFIVGSSTFAITNPAASRFSFKAGIDCGFNIFSRLVLQLSYDYELRSKYNDQSGSCKLKYSF